MRQLRQSALFLALFILALGACRVRSGEEDPDLIVTAPPEFIVDLYEQRDAADGHATFGLWVETVKNDYTAANYRIETSVESGAGQITVRLLDVVAPDQPDGVPGPARVFVPLGDLADGTYAISIRLAETLVNNGTLRIENGHFELSLSGPAAGIDLQNRVLMHIPDTIIWGYVLTPTEIQHPAANAFLLNIKDLTAEPDLAPGYYGYFTVAGTGQVFFHRSVEPQGSAQIFVRRLTAAPNALRGLLDTYRTDQQTPLTIRCWSTGGDL